VYRNVMV